MVKEDVEGNFEPLRNSTEDEQNESGEESRGVEFGGHRNEIRQAEFHAIEVFYVDVWGWIVIVGEGVTVEDRVEKLVQIAAFVQIALFVHLHSSTLGELIRCWMIWEGVLSFESRKAKSRFMTTGEWSWVFFMRVEASRVS